MNSSNLAIFNSVDHYAKNMKGMTKSQREALYFIFNFIHVQKLPKPSDYFEEDKKNIRHEINTMTENDAAILLQRAVRKKFIADRSEAYVYRFFSIRGRESYLEMLDQQKSGKTNSESNSLAQIMFGKTIACVKKYDAAGNDIIIKRDDFPARSHEKWLGTRYHRDDEIKGAFFDSIIQHYEPHFDKNDLYIPFTIVNNASLEDFIQNNLIPGEKKLIKKIYKDDNEAIGLLVLSAVKNKKQKEIRSAIKRQLRSTGLIPSPWEIAKFNVKFANNNITHENVQLGNNDINKNLLEKFPGTIEGLKKSELVIELSKIAVSKKPTKWLAACLHRMIHALPDINTQNEILQRISLFLSFGVNFYENNYERFSFVVYAIIHEISLLINHAINNGIKIADYDQFKKTIQRYSLASLGTFCEDSVNYKTIMAPTMGGAHAFLTALNLAKKMSLKHSSNPIIQVIQPLYYEFDHFLETQNNMHDIADIYVISAGPVVSSDEGLVPGTDINKLIKNKILIAGECVPRKPVTIVVDVTSALYKNLKLSEDTRKLVEQGHISIICNESYQKFGLAHTDQAQAGIIYGICSAISYDNDVINQFETNAKKDFEGHLDMIIAHFIREHCGDYLEKIKEQHFKNGGLFRKFFTTPYLYQRADDTTECLYLYSGPEVNNINYYDEMINNLDELYFFVTRSGPATSDAENQLYLSPYKCFFSRDSFGHFTTTYNYLGTEPSFSRISPNASDELDTIISMITLCLFSKFTENELFNLLNTILSAKSDIDTKFGPEEGIFMAGLLAALLNCALAFKNYDKNEEVKLNVLLRGINHFLHSASNILAGRNVYHHLNDTFINKYSIFSHHDLSKFIDEKPEDINKLVQDGRMVNHNRQ